MSIRNLIYPQITKVIKVTCVTCVGALEYVDDITVLAVFNIDTLGKTSRYCDTCTGSNIRYQQKVSTIF